MAIEDDELLCRRIPVKPGWFDPAFPNKPAFAAFKPHEKNDPTGLSLSRLYSDHNPSFLTPQQIAALGRSPDGYYIALLNAGAVRAHGITIVEDPLPIDPGHVLLPQLNSANRRTSEVQSWLQLLADELTIEVVGPFPPEST